jgi:hypothetical protein
MDDVYGDVRGQSQSRHDTQPGHLSVAPTSVMRARKMRETTVELTPIMDEDVAAVADFLHANLNDQVPWDLACSSVPWKGESPNHGFMLRDGQRVVGALLALYSDRLVAGRVERFCNMGSWCVLTDYRSRSISLLKALLAQEGYHFTVLTADVGPQEILAWSGFRFLDTSAALIPNLPWPTLLSRTRVSGDPDVIERTLAGKVLELYHDHAQALAAHHLVLISGQDSCYVMYRESSYREKPVALILHVSNPDLFHRALIPLTSHLLVRHRLVATLAELQIIERKPLLAFTVNNWPKMFRSASLEPGQIDYLYSELACVPW